MAKSILFLLRTSPLSSDNLAEALDAALVAGVFDQRVAVLFKDDGVTALLVDSHRTPEVERLEELLASLSDYGIEKICVCEESLASRDLTIEKLLIKVEPLDSNAQQSLIAGHDVVIND